MKILIISDTHGNIANIKHVMGFAKQIGVEAVIHCGDWDNIESVNEVLESDIPLYAVLGNADIDLEIEEVLKFNAKGFSDAILKFEIDGRKIAVTHDSKSLENDPHNLDIVFSGHWHSSNEKMINFVKFVRPGSLINGINFAVYETVNNSLEFIKE